jgi:hypothetical protein
MASNSTLAKPVQESNISICATTILVMCCYLYRKRVLQPKFQSYQLAYQLSWESNARNLDNNVNAKGNYEVEMQTPVDDSSIFTEVSRSARASPSPHWSPLQGPNSWSGNFVDSPGSFPCASGSPVSLPTSLFRTAPSYLHYQAFG